MPIRSFPWPNVHKAGVPCSWLPALQVTYSCQRIKGILHLSREPPSPSFGSSRILSELHARGLSGTTGSESTASHFPVFLGHYPEHKSLWSAALPRSHPSQKALASQGFFLGCLFLYLDVPRPCSKLVDPQASRLSISAAGGPQVCLSRRNGFSQLCIFLCNCLLCHSICIFYRPLNRSRFMMKLTFSPNPASARVFPR